MAAALLGSTAFVALLQARLTHKLVGLSEEPISLPKIFTSIIEIGESKSLSLVHLCEPVCLM